MANKILKTLTLPNAQGEPVTYELHPEWDNIEGKPESFGSKGNGIYYIEGTGGSKGYWLGAHEDITEYYAGLTVVYKTNKLDDDGSAVLNINNLGQVSVDISLSTDIAIGSILILTYTLDSNGTASWKMCGIDTKNTAGVIDNTGRKLYLVGSRTQSLAGYDTTYTNGNVYIGTDSCLYSNGEKVITSEATTSADGLMSSEDKAKLDGIEAGAQKNQNAFSTIVTSNGSNSADSPSTSIEFRGQNGITVTTTTSVAGAGKVNIKVDTDWLSSKIDEKIAAITNAEEVGF